MSWSNGVAPVGQQPILTLVLHDPVAEKATEQKIISKTKSLILVLRDPIVQNTTDPRTLTLILHDPVAEIAGLKKEICAAQQVLAVINSQLTTHKPKEGHFAGHQITVLASATVNSDTTQEHIESIRELHSTVEKLEKIIHEHTAGYEDALKKELGFLDTTILLLKGRCKVLLTKQQKVQSMQNGTAAAVANIARSVFNSNFH